MKKWFTALGTAVLLTIMASISVAAAEWYSPIAGSISINSPNNGGGFGYRNHPITGKWKLHAGVDFTACTGTPVRATRAGWLIVMPYDKNGRGIWCAIDHNDGYFSDYQHLSSIVIQGKGKAVEAGELIGYAGETGGVTGPHLHFEIRKGVANQNYDTMEPIDPMQFKYNTGSPIKMSHDPNQHTIPSRALYYSSPVMTGDDVAWVQCVLNKLGINCAIDGSYGPGTKTAVAKFQSKYGLTSDGSCGPATQAKMKALIQPKPVNTRKDIGRVTVGSIPDQTYSGKAFTPTLTVKDGSSTLKNGTDYSVAYKNNVNAGTATITITGKGSYAGVKTVSFKIRKATQTITVRAVENCITAGNTTTVIVSGNKGTVTISSQDTSVAAVSGTGKITAKTPGTVKMLISSAATANYNAATMQISITVLPTAPTSITAENLSAGIRVSWNQVPGATGYCIYRNGILISKLSGGTALSYTDSKAAGNGNKFTYIIVAYAKSGSSTLGRAVTTYRVDRPVISSLKNNASKKMTVKWKKNSKATGYQIQYSISKSFASGNKTITISGKSVVSKVITGLLKGKSYYVRIRTYKTVNKNNYYSEWSNMKSIKVSK